MTTTRKKFKDNLNGIGIIAAVVTVSGFIARLNGYDFPAAIVGWGFMISAASFAIAACIKPRLIRRTRVGVTGKTDLVSEW